MAVDTIKSNFISQWHGKFLVACTWAGGSRYTR